MDYEVTAALNNGEIAVTTDGEHEVALRINGTTRARNRVPAGQPLDCYLTTTVQTDYEHHSLVEIHVMSHGNGIDIVMHVDGRKLPPRQIEFVPVSATSLRQRR